MKTMVVRQKCNRDSQLLPGCSSGMKREVHDRDMTVAGFVLLIIVSPADKFCRILRFWQDLIDKVFADKTILPLFYGSLIVV